MYVRPSPLAGLPDVPFDFLDLDPELASFPTFERDELVGFLDAAHATDLTTRRSVTGFLVFYCCAAIAWKSRLQSLVATSSTEAEFYAAVACAKVVKYLRYILQELDALRPGPSSLFIDNEAALAMINEFRPTPRARHIDIQYFAVQEWRAAEDIIMTQTEGKGTGDEGLSPSPSLKGDTGAINPPLDESSLDTTNTGTLTCKAVSVLAGPKVGRGLGTGDRGLGTIVISIEGFTCCSCSCWSVVVARDKASAKA